MDRKERVKATKSGAGEWKRDGAKIKRGPTGKEGDAAYEREERAHARDLFAQHAIHVFMHRIQGR